MTDFRAIVRWLSGIGIQLVRTNDLEWPTFLPGIEIKKGIIRYNPPEMKSAGDLLHEAGHMAVIPRCLWPSVDIDTDRAPAAAFEAYTSKFPDAMSTFPEDPFARALMQSGETEAIAWSYAAAIEIDVDPEIVFHDGAYGGDERALIAQLGARCHLGIHGLAHARMCELRAFPSMKKWIQDAMPRDKTGSHP